MIGSVLIANRGEIACRVIRTARRLGVRAIAIYSDADRNALHVRLADAALPIGGADGASPYLDGARLIAAARAAGAEAIHPGYGFLSENAAFAEAVEGAGLVWIGAPPAAIRAMGRKDAAKALMQAAGVAVTPGYLGEDQDDARLAQEAARIGYPVLIKAVAGGGGKGMRRVDRAEDFGAALSAARREAEAAFGDGRVLLETYVARPRHIEVQVFADRAGATVHLFERDCSLQRRHQKVIEEAPAPGLSEAVRAEICAAAVRAARAVNYVGAGTVEFLADARDGLVAERIYFMEMNTRLQVEHPVTEAITGLDLVEWQFRVAAGEPLPARQDQIARRGAAIEARLYAEDPTHDFLPSAGPLDHFVLPPGVRIETGFVAGDVVSRHYDPLLAKLIAHAETREAAADALAAACRAVEAWPVKTNAAFLARCLDAPAFRAGAHDTGAIASTGAALTETAPSDAAWSAAAYALAHEAAQTGPWRDLVGFRLNDAARRGVALFHGGDAREIAPLDRAPPLTTLKTRDAVIVFENGAAYAFTAHRARQASDAAQGDGGVRAPIPGRVAAVFVQTGQGVEAGAPLATLEAMKMEYVLAAPFAGRVDMLNVAPGAQVEEGALIARIAR